MKKHALWFVDCNTTELWEFFSEFANASMPYQDFIDTVYKLYPGSDVEQCWLIVDMDKLVGETWRVGIILLADLGKHHREFITITTFLIAKSHISTTEQSCTFAHSFPPELWG